MTQIIVLPHVELCPKGALFEAEPGISICDALLAHNIEIEHACENPAPAPPVTSSCAKVSTVW